jgi:hypothetical protein
MKLLKNKRIRLFLIIVAVVALARLWAPARAWADTTDPSSAWIAWMGKMVLNSLFEAFDWLVGLIVDVAGWLLSPLSGLIPDIQNWPQWAVLQDWFDVFNYWIPLDLFATAAGVYFTLSIALVVYRVVKSFIPTVSG